MASNETTSAATIREAADLFDIIANSPGAKVFRSEQLDIMHDMATKLRMLAQLETVNG